MNEEITNLLNAHKDTIFFWKFSGQWAGGDMREVGKVAMAMGMPSNEIRYDCSGCLDNMRNFIFNQLPENEYKDYKQRKGL